MVASFRVAEEYRDAVCKDDNNKHNVIFPPDRGEGDRVDKGVENNGDYQSDPDKTDATATKVIRPDFDRIGDKKGRTTISVSLEVHNMITSNLQSDVVASKVDEEQRYYCQACRRGASRRERCGQASDSDVADQHDHKRAQEEQSSSQPINQQSSACAEQKIPDLEACGDECLIACAGDANSVEHQCEII